jgi:hypothetical protein
VVYEIFMDHASCAITSLDPQMTHAGYAVGQRVERRGLVQGAVWPVGVIKVLRQVRYAGKIVEAPSAWR